MEVVLSPERRPTSAMSSSYIDPNAPPRYAVCVLRVEDVVLLWLLSLWTLLCVGICHGLDIAVVSRRCIWVDVTGRHSACGAALGGEDDFHGYG